MNSAMAIYLRAFSTALGEGSYNPFSYSNDVAITSVDDLLKLKLGPGGRFDSRIGSIGITFRLVKAKSALGAGDILKPYIGGAGRTGTLASATALAVTTASSLTASELAGGLLFLTANTAAPALRAIKDNSGDAGASTITVAGSRDYTHGTDPTKAPDAFGTLPDNTTTFSTYCPWEVTQSTAVTDLVIGVALNSVTSGNYTVICERGPVLANVIGSTDAATAAGLLVPSSTAGTLKGPTTAAMTAAEAARACGFAIDAYAGAKALRLIHFQTLFNI